MAPEPVDRAALVVLQQLAVVVREQVSVVQVQEEQVLAKEELQLVLAAVGLEPKIDVHVVVRVLLTDVHVVVREPLTDVHVVLLLVLAKRVLEQEAGSPATRVLHSPHDLAALVAVAQSVARSGYNEVQNDRNGARALPQCSSAPEPKGEPAKERG